MPADKDALDAEALARRVPATRGDMIACVGMTGHNLNEDDGPLRRIESVDQWWQDSYDVGGSCVSIPRVDAPSDAPPSDESGNESDDSHDNVDTEKFMPDCDSPMACQWLQTRSAFCQVCYVCFDADYVDWSLVRNYLSDPPKYHRFWDCRIGKYHQVYSACGRCAALQGRIRWQWVALRFRMQAIADWWLKQAMGPKNVATAKSVDQVMAPTRRRIAYIATGNNVVPVLRLPDVDFVMLSPPRQLWGLGFPYFWFVQQGAAHFADMVLGCLGRESWRMLDNGVHGVLFTSKTNQTVQLFMNMTELDHTKHAYDAVRSCDEYFLHPDKKPIVDERSVVDGMHFTTPPRKTFTGYFRPASDPACFASIGIGTEWILVPCGELAPKDIARLEAAPLHMLVTLVSWDYRSVLHGAAHKPLRITSGSDAARDADAEQDAVVSVLTRRLLHAPCDEAFWWAIDALMLGIMSECPARTSDSRWVGDAARVLVAISNRLDRSQLVALKDRLVADVHRSREHEYEWFPAANLLPVLCARHPSLGIHVERVVIESLEHYIDADYAVEDIGAVVASLVDLRIHLDQGTCDAVCDTLLRSFSPEDGEWPWNIVQQTLSALSRPAMRWLRLKFRVRVIGRLSLMRAASAEKLYTPGGSGAGEVLCELKRLAPLVDDLA